MTTQIDKLTSAEASFIAAEVANQTASLKARIVELEAELAWRGGSRLDAIDDEEIRAIISNL